VGIEGADCGLVGGGGDGVLAYFGSDRERGGCLERHGTALKIVRQPDRKRQVM
jgi:hypothetical protein